MLILTSILITVLVVTIGNMGRLARFSRSVAFCVLGVFWCMVGLVLYVAAALGGGRTEDFVMLLALWASGFALLLWLALRNFRQALRPLPKSQTEGAPHAGSSPAGAADMSALGRLNMERANEELSSLVKEDHDTSKS